ncbi:MAG: site-2 protease family protein [Gammaproteobacteria bacterium]|jgi:Zn-dependent protease
MAEFTFIQKIAIYAIPIIFAITVHEAAHGIVASYFGDQTARLSGRLTLNPIKHIDPIGTVVLPLIMLAFGGIIFGWAKPVPVDWRNLRKPKQDMAWVAIAGPGANFIMMVLWVLFAKMTIDFRDVFQGFTEPMLYMAYAGVQINIILMLLNMLPVPPLDGSRVVSSLLPPRMAQKYNSIEPYGIIIVLGLVILLFMSGIAGAAIYGLMKYALSFVM